MQAVHLVPTKLDSLSSSLKTLGFDFGTLAHQGSNTYPNMHHGILKFESLSSYTAPVSHPDIPQSIINGDSINKQPSLF